MLNICIYLCFSVYLFKEIYSALRRVEFPQRGNSPAWCKKMVIKTFSIATIIPCGVLHHLRIENRLSNIKVVLVGRHQLAERRVDNVVHLCKACFARNASQPLHNVGQLEHEHVDMGVLNRYVAPATRLEVDVAQHLALCEGHIPGVVPRHGKIGSLLAQVDIVSALFAFGYHS